MGKNKKNNSAQDCMKDMNNCNNMTDMNNCTNTTDMNECTNSTQTQKNRKKKGKKSNMQ